MYIICALQTWIIEIHSKYWLYVIRFKTILATLRWLEAHTLATRNTHTIIYSICIHSAVAVLHKQIVYTQCGPLTTACARSPEALNYTLVWVWRECMRRSIGVCLGVRIGVGVWARVKFVRRSSDCLRPLLFLFGSSVSVGRHGGGTAICNSFIHLSCDNDN